jgi:hypothetical protein
VLPDPGDHLDRWRTLVPMIAEQFQQRLIAQPTGTSRPRVRRARSRGDAFWGWSGASSSLNNVGQRVGGLSRAGGRRHGGLEQHGQQPAICGRRGGEGRRAPARRQAALLQTRINWVL